MRRGSTFTDLRVAAQREADKERRTNPAPFKSNRRFMVWAVYGTIDGKLGQLIQDYPHNAETAAREHAARVVKGYVLREKR